MTPDELRKLADQKINEAGAIVSTALVENRDVSPAESSRFDALHAEADRLQKQASALVARLDADAESVRNMPKPARVAPAPDLFGIGERTNDGSTVGPFDSLGSQLRSVAAAGMPGGEVDRRLHDIRAASGLGSNIPSDGGFMLQPEATNLLLSKTYSTGEILKRCFRLPISTSQIKIPFINETSRADGSRLGGVRAYWKSEAELMTKSKPKFGSMDLELEYLTALVYASDNLLEDSPALSALVDKKLPQELSFTLEDAIINGSGAGQPLGILNSAALVTVPKEGGQGAATIMPENIFNMWSRLWGPSRANSVWLINADIEPQLFSMTLPVGTGGTAVYMPSNGISGSPFATLMGRPVVPVEHCATLGSVGDIVLADFSEYLLVEHSTGIKSESSIHVRFLYNETAFRFVMRADGQSGWASVLTPKNSTATQSPFVTLAAR